MSRRAEPQRVDRLRLTKAIAVVIVIALVVPYAGAVLEKKLGETSGEGLPTNDVDAIAEGWFADEDAWTTSPLDALTALEESLAAVSSPPREFIEEAGVPPESRDIRTSARGDVVSCIVDAPESVAYQLASQVLCDCGWSAVPLSGVTGATFVKGTGAMRWLLVTCSQVGLATTVVYRIG